MKKLGAYFWLVALAGLLLWPAPSVAQFTSPTPSLIVVVRHAEKAADSPDNPSLNDLGKARARDLAAALKDINLAAIITSQYRRTRETAVPTAIANRLTPEVAPIDPDDLNAYIHSVVALARRHHGKPVLVISHGDTVGEIIAAFGGPRLETICDNIYDHLYLLRPGPSPQLDSRRYGARSPAPEPGCI